MATATETETAVPRLKQRYEEEIRVRVCKRDGCGQEVDR